MAAQETVTLTRAQVEELRAIIHNAESPLGNRLQDVSARLYFALEGAGWNPASGEQAGAVAEPTAEKNWFDPVQGGFVKRTADDFSSVNPPMCRIAGVNPDVLRRAALAAPGAAIAAREQEDHSTPGQWFVRKRERDGKLLDCFVAAPDFLGLPYDAEILGDDEYRDGKNDDQEDGSGIRRKLADCELIVKAVSFYRAALAQPTTVQQAEKGGA